MCILANCSKNSLSEVLRMFRFDVGGLHDVFQLLTARHSSITAFTST